MELPAGGPARQGIARNLGVFRRERKLRPARMADRSGKEIRQHTRRYREEYVEAKNGNGYLMRKYLFPNGKVIMPAEAMTDVTAIFE